MELWSADLFGLFDLLILPQKLLGAVEFAAVLQAKHLNKSLAPLLLMLPALFHV